MAGTPGACSQVFCHPNLVHASSARVERHTRRTQGPRPSSIFHIFYVPWTSDPEVDSAFDFGTQSGTDNWTVCGTESGTDYWKVLPSTLKVVRCQIRGATAGTCRVTSDREQTLLPALRQQPCSSVSLMMSLSVSRLCKLCAGSRVDFEHATRVFRHQSRPVLCPDVQDKCAHSSSVCGSKLG